MADNNSIFETESESFSVSISPTSSYPLVDMTATNVHSKVHSSHHSCRLDTLDCFSLCCVIISTSAVHYFTPWLLLFSTCSRHWLLRWALY